MGRERQRLDLRLLQANEGLNPPAAINRRGTEEFSLSDFRGSMAVLTP